MIFSNFKLTKSYKIKIIEMGNKCSSLNKFELINSNLKVKGKFDINKYQTFGLLARYLIYYYLFRNDYSPENYEILYKKNENDLNYIYLDDHNQKINELKYMKIQQRNLHTVYIFKFW